MKYTLHAAAFRGNLTNVSEPRSVWWDATIETSDGTAHRNHPGHDASGNEVRLPFGSGGYVFDTTGKHSVAASAALAQAKTTDDVAAAIRLDIERAAAELEARVQPTHIEIKVD